MALIAILISLVVERFLGSMEEFRRFGWFRRYARAFSRRLAGIRFLSSPLVVLLILLPPLAAVAALDYYLSQWWIILSLALGIVLLLFSYGPTDLEAEVEAYVDAQERGDEESACWHAAELIGCEPPEHSPQLTRRIVENTLVEANERLLAVLLWFLLLGPAGALFYRLTTELAEDSETYGNELLSEAAARLHAILAWLPARLCALAYALAGSFVESLQAWREQDGVSLESSREVLIASGLGAMGYEPGEESSPEHDSAMVHEALALVRRAVLVFLSVLALFTLAGWMT